MKPIKHERIKVKVIRHKIGGLITTGCIVCGISKIEKLNCMCENCFYGTIAEYFDKVIEIVGRNKYRKGDEIEIPIVPRPEFLRSSLSIQ